MSELAHIDTDSLLFAALYLIDTDPDLACEYLAECESRGVNTVRVLRECCRDQDRPEPSRDPGSRVLPREPADQ